jgi:hypothetical protein
MNTFEFKKILVRPNTMVDNSAINGLYNICHKVIKDNIDGDFVETGVWRGGLSAIFLRKIIRNNLNKNLYLYDTFEGNARTYCNRCKNDRNCWIFGLIGNGLIQKTESLVIGVEQV